MKSKKSHFFVTFNEKFILECEGEHASVKGVTGREAVTGREVHDPWPLAHAFEEVNTAAGVFKVCTRTPLKWGETSVMVMRGCRDSGREV